jgi:hypothetical protein
MQPKNKPIREILQEVGKKEMLLPAIQRNFVWRENQISNFLDSLIRDYPTGTLLLWEKPNKNNVVMKPFVDNYKKRILNKPIDSKNIPKDCCCVLDGQQRISSLNIAFMGSYEGKDLYFDLNSGKDGEEYSFGFFKEAEIKKYKEKNWISVKKILEGEKLTQKKLKELHISKKEEVVIRKIRDIYYKKALCCYKINQENEDDILEIFKRINSEGTKLTKTDFLFSSLISSWKEGKSLIKELVDEVSDNLGGDSSRIDGDFILRTAMYLIGEETKVSIKKLCKKENVDKITSEWNEIQKSIITASKLIRSWGFNIGSITSMSAFLPVAYFIHVYQPSKSADKIESKYKKLLKNFYIFSQLNRLFNSSVDNKLKTIRDCFNTGKPWENFEKKWPNVFRYDKKSAKADAEKILMKYNYSEKNYCNLILTLLNPKLNYFDSDFHIDHLHPKSFFINSKDASVAEELNQVNISDNEKKKWMNMCNQLPNLGLLRGPINESKGDTSLEKWLKKNEGDYRDNFISKKISLRFKDFRKLFDYRKKQMCMALAEILKDKPVVTYKPKILKTKTPPSK